MSYYNHQKSRSWKEGDYSYMNKTLDEYAEDFLSLVEDASCPIKEALRKLAGAVNCEEITSLYFNLILNHGSLLMTLPGHGYFFGSLYAYHLCHWFTFFKPGRVMIIQSEVYYEKRQRTLNTLAEYIMGAPLSSQQQKEALEEHKVFNSRRDSYIIPGSELSNNMASKLRKFYGVHNSGVHRILNLLKGQGSWVVGFEDTDIW
jgi:hypothetical protein